MFLARVGVGVGEAALSPAAFSLLADYFPPAKRARALSVYSAAIYVGTGVANIAGGAAIALVPAMVLPVVGEMEPWRMVFVIVGLPGILVCALMATVREPARTGLMAGQGAAQEIPFSRVYAFVWERKRVYGLMVLSFGVKSMLWNGITAWVPAHMARTYGWAPGETGLWYGLAMAAFGTAGIITGGSVSSRMRSQGKPEGYLWVAIVAALVMLPVGMIAPLMPTGELSLAVYCVFIFFGSFPVGAQATAFQEITPNQMRAQVSALYLFGNNLMGIGLGPSLVAAFTTFVFADDLALRYSLIVVTAIVAPTSALITWLALKPFKAGFESAKALGATT
jgi:MFS family permease